VEIRGHREQADAEGEHARMEVGLEGVGARARDVVAQREGGRERIRRPRIGVEPPADAGEAAKMSTSERR
jgi:hypothetical protein